jgi:TPR repeat protein
MEWLRKAADKGHATAMYNIGVMYDNGYGVTQDNAKAEEWYKKAKDAGYRY